MNKFFKTTLFGTVFLTLLLYPALLGAEYIFLKTGKILRGIIVTDRPGIIVARIAGKRQMIRRDGIIRILYTDLKMEKVYIRKRDGTRILAYIIDEDRESYVCRTKLYSPEEFRIRRSDVLFVAEKNPSGLAGEAGMTDAELTWFPPYEMVKNYNIYAKRLREEKYKKIASTTDEHMTVKDLKSNTEYSFIVKSVDSDDGESLPSNELKLVTKNIPPLPPGNTWVKEDGRGNYEITWSKGADPDGTVKEYKLYRVLYSKTSLLASTAKRIYRIEQDVGYDRIYIKSLDNLESESESAARVYLPLRPEIHATVLPAYLFPFGNLKDAAMQGYGGTLRGGVSNYFFTGLDLGIEVSYFYFPGRGDISEIPENGITDIVLVPVQFFAGYSFYPFRAFRVSPAVYAGECYVRERHSSFDILTSSEKRITTDGFEPLFGVGLTVRRDISLWFFALSAGYRFIAEKSGGISYLSLSPSVGIRF